MKLVKLSIGMLACLLLSSCFKEEPLNAECDIEAVTVHLAQPLEVFYNTSDTMKIVASADSVITFNTRGKMASAVTPEALAFVLTPGATLSAPQGTIGEDGGTLRYTVTSEDRMWHRDYSVRVQPVVHSVADTVYYDFERYELEPSEQKYYVWHDELGDGTYGNNWADGNAGFRLSMGTAKPNEYPTIPVTAGHSGAAVQLSTLSTGPFGVLANKRIAAGNLFLGSFDVTSAMLDPMHATRFGIPFDWQPIIFTGYYMYVPGPTYQDRNGKAVSGKKDRGAIYAVLYRNHDSQGNRVTLYGDDVKTSPQVVAIADMGDVAPTNGWQQFSVNFVYHEDIDLDLLAARGYSLAIVFSSSNEGDQFEGAIGSTMLIDEVRVICKKEE